MASIDLEYYRQRFLRAPPSKREDRVGEDSRVHASPGYPRRSSSPPASSRKPSLEIESSSGQQDRARIDYVDGLTSVDSARSSHSATSFFSRDRGDALGAILQSASPRTARKLLGDLASIVRTDSSLPHTSIVGADALTRQSEAAVPESCGGGPPGKQESHAEIEVQHSRRHGDIVCDDEAARSRGCQDPTPVVPALPLSRSEVRRTRAKFRYDEATKSYVPDRVGSQEERGGMHSPVHSPQSILPGMCEPRDAAVATAVGGMTAKHDIIDVALRGKATNSDARNLSAMRETDSGATRGHLLSETGTPKRRTDTGVAPAATSMRLTAVSAACTSLQPSPADQLAQQLRLDQDRRMHPVDIQPLETVQYLTAGRGSASDSSSSKAAPELENMIGVGSASMYPTLEAIKVEDPEITVARLRRRLARLGVVVGNSIGPLHDQQGNDARARLGSGRETVSPAFCSGSSWKHTPPVQHTHLQSERGMDHTPRFSSKVGQNLRQRTQWSPVIIESVGVAPVQGVASADMAPVQEVASADMAPVQGVASADMAPVQGVASADMAPVQSAASAGMAPVQGVASADMAPVQSVASADMAPVQSVASAGMAPVQEVASAGMAPVHEVASADMAPVQGVASAGMAPVQEVASADMAPVQGVASADMAPVQSVASAGMAPVQSVASADMAPVQEVASADMAPVQGVASADMAPVQGVASADMAPVQGVASADMAPVQAADIRRGGARHQGARVGVESVGGVIAAGNYEVGSQSRFKAVEIDLMQAVARSNERVAAAAALAGTPALEGIGTSTGRLVATRGPASGASILGVAHGVRERSEAQAEHLEGIPAMPPAPLPDLRTSFSPERYAATVQKEMRKWSPPT